MESTTDIAAVTDREQGDSRRGDLAAAPQFAARKGFRASVRRDIERLTRAHPGFLRSLGVILTNRGFQAVFLYRVANKLWKWRVPAMPLFLSRLAQFFYAVDISHKADLGPGIVIVHGFGLVIGSAVRIAGDCYLFHGVTLGDRGSEWVGSDREDGHPTVEKEVMFGAGAKILGPLHVGRNSVIGANAVVIKDVPPNSIVVGIPGKVVGTRPEMDDNLRPIRRANDAASVTQEPAK